MCRTGPDIKSARCFSEPPVFAAHHCTTITTTTTTMSPAPKRKIGRKSIRARDDDDGAALPCIRSSSCHPSPRHKVLSGAMQCEELSVYHVNHHTRSRSFTRAWGDKQDQQTMGAHTHTHTLTSCRQDYCCMQTTQTRTAARPTEQERPAVIGLPIRICPAAKPNVVQKRLPTGLTQGPGFSLPAGERRKPWHTHALAAAKRSCADRRAATTGGLARLLLGTVLRKRCRVTCRGCCCCCCRRCKPLSGT